jgi:hypothetical protein
MLFKDRPLEKSALDKNFINALRRHTSNLILPASSSRYLLHDNYFLV